MRTCTLHRTCNASNQPRTAPCKKDLPSSRVKPQAIGNNEMKTSKPMPTT